MASSSRRRPTSLATSTSRSTAGYSQGPSESTLLNGPSSSHYSRSAPSHSHRALRRNTFPAPAFSCDIPEDPLRAAMNLETVLEHPTGESENTDVVYSLLDFSRRRVGAIEPHNSALTTALEYAASRPNPFNEAISAGGDAEGPLTVGVCFPHAESPVAQVLTLAVPLHATVEDVIARALSAYWAKGWLPALEGERDLDVREWIVLVPGSNGVVEKRIASNKISDYHKYDLFTVVQKPTTHAEKRQIQKQILKFDLLCPPSVVHQQRQRGSEPQQQQKHDNRSHSRNYSLPHTAFKSRSRPVDALTGPLSYSRLP
ncbi:hypothetical protein C8F01DRAFT_1252179 [Mycena amicta]|nr:hypothetical protein C8F01DRAFT_1252179 [Mycena amicta]